jgi:pyruvate dehydrogenase E1 component alpha subunit
MVLKTVAAFEVKYLQVIDESGAADEGLLTLSIDDLKRLFETIFLSRTFNTRALSLQREGRIGTYASIWGQEGCQTGSAIALAKEDWVFPSFRETGVLISLGYPMWMLYRYWMGDERGMKCPDDLNAFPMSVPVGTQIPHAMGTAWAMKLKGHKKASVVYFGDGGSSRGDFHEALNLAGVFKVPAVFICQNNQWAISLPRRHQTAAETIAQKALSYGMEGIQVDGNDAAAVYRATSEALKRAKEGKGPTLVECFTYRLDDHTTADDAKRYRSPDEVEEWKAKEPLIRLRAYLKSKGAWDEGYEENLKKECEARVASALKEAEAFSPPGPADIINHTYATLTPRQAKELKELGWRG